MTSQPEHLNLPDIVDAPRAPYSSIVLDGHYAHFAGVVAADFAEGRAVLGDVAAETDAVMTVIKRLLGEIGLEMGHVVRCDVHLVDFTDMDAMNAAYRTFFDDGRCPARTCTQSGALYGGARVEITCTAFMSS